MLNRRSRSVTLLCLLLLIGPVTGAQAQQLNDLQLEQAASWFAAQQDNADPAAAPELPRALSREQAEQSLQELWTTYQGAIFDEQLGALPPRLSEVIERVRAGGQGIEPGVMKLGELAMPYVVLRRETQPVAQAGRPLFICTHGGGRNETVNGPHAWPVNSREWQTQVQLAAQHYGPEGIYFVPRMADDRMGRWYHAHNQDAFERVAEHAIAHWGVDPNRVYLLGISEGGYGTAILAPFMPDRFGGANAMAAGVDLGNPAENLRNLAFRTDVGENDTTFNRAGLAIKFHERLEALRAEDTQEYTHSINVQQGRGHGIDYRPGVEWIAGQQRDPWPQTITWLGKQVDGRRRGRMYWIEVDGKYPTSAIRIAASADAKSNAINIEAELLKIEGDGGNPTHATSGTVTKSLRPTGITLRVLLHDDLVDLDRPLTVTCNGAVVFEGRASRDAAVQLRTLAGYGDPAMTACAEISIPLD